MKKISADIALVITQQNLATRIADVVPYMEGCMGHDSHGDTYISEYADTDIGVRL